MLRGCGFPRRVAGARALGSWAKKFEKARGASLEVRQSLGKELEDVWELHQDEEEAKAMEAEAGEAAGKQITFVLSVESTAIGIIRAALMPSKQTTGGPSGLLIGAQVDPALSLSSVGKPLVRAARNELLVRGAEPGRIVAVAPLIGLNQWIVDNQRWSSLDESAEDFDADQPGAVEAIAKGVPRPGHSVLGQGTFKAGKPAFMRLAMEYAARAAVDPDMETAMFANNGFSVANVNWMHATGPDDLKECAGCTVTLRSE